MNDASAQNVTARHIGVFVVHGVGEVAPGEVTSMLVEALGSVAAAKVDQELEVLRLSEQGMAPPEGRHVAETGAPPATFPAYIRRATMPGGERVTFAELYWGDLTHIGVGRLTTLMGIFRVVFEAHHLIGAMLDPEVGPLARGLRALLLWLSLLLRGPLAAWTACVLLICWLAVNVRPQGGLLFFGTPDPDWLAVSSMLVMAATGAGLFWLAHVRRDRTWNETMIWVVIVPFALGVLYVFRHWGGGFTAAEWLDETYGSLVYAWQIWGALFIVALALVGLYAVSSLVQDYGRGNGGRRSASVVTAAGILALQFLLWTAIAGALALPLLGRAKDIIDLSTLQSLVPLDAAVPVDLTKSNGILDIPNIHAGQLLWIDRFKFAYGFNGLIVLVFLLGIAAVLLARLIVVLCFRANFAKGARAMPRLLFSRTSIAALLLMVLIQIVVHVELRFFDLNWEDIIPGEITRAAGWLGAALGLDTVANSLGSTNDGWVTNYKYGINIVAVASALILPIVLGDRLNNGLHIARDLIDHQFGPYERASRSALKAHVLPLEEQFPRRARIQRRLQTLLENIVQREQLDGVVFVAHSQGSVVVYDFLLQAAPGYEKLAGAKPAVVTCGSPLSHIYREYFCEYNDLHSELEQLQGDLRGWHNVYRLDDYIGTHLGTNEAPTVINKALPAGGHADYWKEPALVRIVCEAIARAAVVEAGADAAKTA